MIWDLWKARNNLLFNNKLSDTEFICRQAESFFKEYSHPSYLSQIEFSREEASTPMNCHWKPPPLEALKINVDGACGEGHAAAGAIIRDHLGGFVGCATKVLETTYPMVAEVEAFKFGIQLIRDLQLSNIIIEGDAKVVVENINMTSDSTPWRIKNQIQDCKNFLLLRRDVTVSFTPRLANGVAHALAKFSIDHDVTNVWSGGLPPPPLLDPIFF